MLFRGTFFRRARNLGRWLESQIRVGYVSRYVSTIPMIVGYTSRTCILFGCLHTIKLTGCDVPEILLQVASNQNHSLPADTNSKTYSVRVKCTHGPHVHFETGTSGILYHIQDRFSIYLFVYMYYLNAIEDRKNNQIYSTKKLLFSQYIF